MSFTIGSLFSGSGGFELAASMYGGVPVWASEIEPYPIAVTRSRFPNMKHLGSVTDINGAEIEPVDVITFGSPCQDLSVAGKRAGLKHEDNGDEETTRSGLFMEAVRIIKEMREATNGEYPKFAVWENVPGAFSSNKGEDFRIVLEELIKIVEPSAVMPGVPQAGWAYADSYSGDGWSLAYRVLDAQYWGVPQRRRRIYLVLDLRGQRAKEILFKSHGLRGYFAEGRTPWQSVARNAEGGTGANDREGKCVAYSFDPLASNSMKSSNPHSGCRQVEVAKCLDTTNPDPSKNQGGVAVLEPVADGCVAFHLLQDPVPNSKVSPCMGQGNSEGGQASIGVAYPADPVIAIDQQGGKGGANYAVDVMPTICSDSHGTPHAVAYGINGEVAATLDASYYKGCGMRQGIEREVVAVPVTLEPGIAAREGGHIYEGVSGTLRAKAGDNQMAVAYGTVGAFCPETGGNDPSRSVAFSEELSPTLRAGATPAVVYNGENITHPLNKTNPQPGDPCHTLGTDSRNYVVCCIDGDKIGKAERSGGSGLGIRDGDKMYTLTAKDAGTHSLCYAMQGFGDYKESDVSSGLKARDFKDATDLVVETPVAYGVDCRNLTESHELYPTLQAKSNGGQSLNYSGAVRVRYIVRRLTPTECARLQGFPDKWGHPAPKTEFTDEEYRFWLNVRNTHAAIMGKQVKDYTKDQMLKWYGKLHTDSSEYKLWGNGIALPNAMYVMQGIADVLN